MRVRFVLLVVVFCMSLVLVIPADAQWQNLSGDLPGIDHHVGLELGLVGAGSAALVGFLVYHHHHIQVKIAAGPVRMPAVLAFARSEKTQEFSIANTSSVPLNVSEIKADRGFSIDGQLQLPVLLGAGEQLGVPVSRDPHLNARRGRISVTMIDPNGKTINRLVALHAARLPRAQ
jgi:hypothetical protein